MTERVKLHAIQQHPSEKEFWDGAKLWRMIHKGITTEFHAEDRNEAEARVREWFPDAVFYNAGRGTPPVNRKRVK